MSETPAHIISRLNADPRSGGGLAFLQGIFGFDGTNLFQQISTGANDWRRLRCDQSALGANATTITFGSLNGDLDGGYLLRAQLIAPVGGGTYFLRANGGAVTGESRRANVDAAGIATSASGTDIILSSIGASAITTLYALITSRTGRVRRSLSLAYWQAADRNIELSFGQFADTVTNFTGLDITASAANAILAGSRAELYTFGGPLL